MLAMKNSNQKLKNIVHYVCRKCSSDPAKLGKLRLHKAIYLADLYRFGIKAKPISGATFVKKPFGPCVYELDNIIEALKKEGKLNVTAPSNEDDFDSWKFVGKGDADMSEFEEREVRIIDEQIEEVLSKSAEQLSDKTHGPVWQMADMGERMPLHALIAMKLTDTSQDDVQLALKALAET